jgi:hypothetical protein
LFFIGLALFILSFRFRFWLGCEHCDRSDEGIQPEGERAAQVIPEGILPPFAAEKRMPQDSQQRKCPGNIQEGGHRFKTDHGHDAEEPYRDEQPVNGSGRCQLLLAGKPETAHSQDQEKYGDRDSRLLLPKEEVEEPADQQH